MSADILFHLQKAIFESFQLEKNDLQLETPPKKEFWDYAFGAFQLARDLRKSPLEIANTLYTELQKMTHPSIEKLELVGPYINIYVKKSLIIEQYREYLQNKSQTSQNKEIIIVDYIGANVGKPLHIGHMCTPNIGQALINTYRALGYEVIGDSHIGDWGIIFWKLIVAYKKFGSNEELHKDAVEHLFQLYVKISDYAEKDTSLEQDFRDEFKLLSEWDPESVELWKRFTSSSIDSMQKQLSRLGIEPTYNIGESFYEGIWLPKLWGYPDLRDDMHSIVKELVKNWIATQNDDGSVGVVFPEELKIPSCMLQKRDGTHGYLASDLATIKYRMQNWAPEKIVYSVDVRQQLHLRQVFTIADMAGWLELWREWKAKTELFHAYNGFIALKDGAMSTRKWRIIKLGDLLDEAEKRAQDIVMAKRPDISPEEKEDLGKKVGIGAIKYGYLKKSRETDVIFDWDEFLTFEGNSGPYIQYAYVRAKNILEKTGEGEEPLNDVEIQFEEEANLIKKILTYAEALEETAKQYAPHILARYIYELTKDFSAFYSTVPVVSEEDISKKNFRISLISEFTQTLKSALQVLGIEVPEKM